MFCETTSPTGEPCPEDSVGGQIDSALSFAVLSPNFDPNTAFDGITVGELLSILDNAVSTVKTANWTSVIDALISFGPSSIPNFSETLNLLRQFEAGDFSVFDRAIDISTRALAPFPLDMPASEALAQAQFPDDEIDVDGLVVPNNFEFQPNDSDPNSVKSPVYELKEDGSWFSKDTTDSDPSDGFDWGNGNDRDGLFTNLVAQAKNKINEFLDSAAESRGVSSFWNTIKKVGSVKDALKSAHKDFWDGLKRMIDGDIQPGNEFIDRGIKTLDDEGRKQLDGDTAPGLFDSLNFSIQETNSFQAVVHDSSETILGSNFRDAIYTGSSDQRVEAQNGDDIIVNGAGSNTIIGGEGRDTVVFLENHSNYMVTYRPITQSFYVFDEVNNSSDTIDVEIWKFKDKTIDLSGWDNTTSPTRDVKDLWATPIKFDNVVTGGSGPGFDSNLKTVSIELDAGKEYQFGISVKGFTPIKPGRLDVTGFLNGVEVLTQVLNEQVFNPSVSGTYTFDLFALAASGNTYTFEINETSKSSWKEQPENIEIAASTYQFFTEKIPGGGGFEYLISSAENNFDLNDPYYSQFNTENKFINFANNLGSFGEGASAFQAKFGARSFEETVKLAFEEIIGTAAIIADGGNPDDSLDFFIGAKSYYTAVANERVVPAGVDFDQALKVVAVGSILNEAMKANLGRYSDAIDNVIDDISTIGSTNFFEQNLFG